MSVTLQATLVSASAPRPVQIALDGVPAGAAYEITKTTPDGGSWPVSGGRGVSTGSQVVLTDNRAPINTPVTYRVAVAGVTYSATPVFVAVDGVAVVQTADGRTAVVVEVASSTEPRSAVSRSSVFEIAGRSDPAARLDVHGSFEYPWAFDVQGADSAVLEQILRAGPVIVRRLEPGMRDLAPVTIALVTSWKDELITEGLDTWRRFSLNVRELADPEPSARLVAFTWDDFDAAMSSRTWDDFDGLFDTWDQFDTVDWSLL